MADPEPKANCRRASPDAYANRSSDASNSALTAVQPRGHSDGLGAAYLDEGVVAERRDR